MINRAAIAVACVVAALQTTAGFAQSRFPQRDITFIEPWNAGGSNDVAARALDPILREHGIKVVIENVVGATGTIGMRRVATAAPDGYTIGMGTSSTLALIAQGKTPLKNTDFTHLARVSSDPLMLLVPSNAPQKSLDEFIGYMKSNPDKVTIGTPGNYNLNHIFASMTARAAGVNFVNVPYTGGSKVVADLLGQHVDSGVKAVGNLSADPEDLLKPLGVFANDRSRCFRTCPPSRTRVDVFPTARGADGLRRRTGQLPADVRTS